MVMQLLVALPVWLLGGLAMLAIRPMEDGPLVARRRADRYLSAMLFSGALLVYALTMPGLTTTLDEDIAAATRALVRGQTFAIDAYSRSFHDSSKYEDHFYSHKNPASSLLAAPFYTMGQFLGRRESVRELNGSTGNIHIPSSPPPQFVDIHLDNQLVPAIRLTILKTAARPENLMLLDVDGGVDGNVFDGYQERIKALQPNERWRRTDSTLAWPAQSGGIELPLTVDWLTISADTSRVRLSYSGLFPEMVATVVEVQSKNDMAEEWAPANVKEIRYVSWVEGQRQLSALGSVLCSAATVVLVFLIARRMDTLIAPALVGAKVLAIASLYWRYATVLYNHAPLAVATLGMLHATIAGYQDAEKRSAWALKASLWMGLGILTDTVFALPLIVGVAAWGWMVITRPHQRFTIVRQVAVPVAIAMVLLGGYQWRCFGAPWRTPNQYAYDHEWLRSIKTAFDYPLIDGIRLLLLGNGRDVESGVPPRFVVDPQDYRGLLVAEPVLILAVAGLAMARNRRRFETVLLSAVFVTTLAAMAMFHTPWGGGDEDTRYLYHVTPILYVGVALWMDYIWRGMGRTSSGRFLRPPYVQAGLIIVTGFTIFLGLRQSWEHLGEGLGRWDTVWRTGNLILPAVPKPLCFVSLWIVLPLIAILFWRLYVTTKPLDSVSQSKP